MPENDDYQKASAVDVPSLTMLTARELGSRRREVGLERLEESVDALDMARVVAG
jgi:hypothetical protein